MLNSCASDNQLYRQIFPDSGIANLFQQADTKVKHVIQYKIKPYVFNLILLWKIIHYLIYWSAKSNEIITLYIGSLFGGHCPAADFLQHFQTFVSKLSLDVCLLMKLGMDGPNVRLTLGPSIPSFINKQTSKL